MDWPGNNATITIKSITPDRLPKKSIKDVTMLGMKESLPWKSTAAGLQVIFPRRKPCNFAHVLRITTGP